MATHPQNPAGLGNGESLGSDRGVLGCCLPAALCFHGWWQKRVPHFRGHFCLCCYQWLDRNRVEIPVNNDKPFLPGLVRIWRHVSLPNPGFWVERFNPTGGVCSSRNRVGGIWEKM